jgi:hypothetical protein
MADPMNIPGVPALSAVLACMSSNGPTQDLPSSRRSLSYHSVEIDGLNIF